MMFILLLLIGISITCAIGYFSLLDLTRATESDRNFTARPPKVDSVEKVPDCSESTGLVSTLAVVGDGSRARWECNNYTGYTDPYGREVGGNCKGVVSYDGRVECECIPTVDPVTKKVRPTTQFDVQNVQLCVSDADLFEAD